MILTDRRVVILKALMEGPKSWTLLRAVYYPTAERQKSSASTSFFNQLKKMQSLGLIQKTVLGYEITALGKELLSK